MKVAVSVVIPMTELYSCGVGHLYLPPTLRLPFESGEILNWLDSTQEGEKLPENHRLRSHVESLDRYIDSIITAFSPKLRSGNSEIMRQEVNEENGWHYDSDGTDWSKEDSITDADRRSPHGEYLKCSYLFPRNQPQTVVKPWRGLLEGVEVQATQDYATFFLGRITFHRADRKPGIRGRYIKFLEEKK